MIPHPPSPPSPSRALLPPPSRVLLSGRSIVEFLTTILEWLPHAPCSSRPGPPFRIQPALVTAGPQRPSPNCVSGVLGFPNWVFPTSPSTLRPMMMLRCDDSNAAVDIKVEEEHSCSFSLKREALYTFDWLLNSHRQAIC